MYEIILRLFKPSLFFGLLSILTSLMLSTHLGI